METLKKDYHVIKLNEVVAKIEEFLSKNIEVYSKDYGKIQENSLLLALDNTIF